MYENNARRGEGGEGCARLNFISWARGGMERARGGGLERPDFEISASSPQRFINPWWLSTT